MTEIRNPEAERALLAAVLRNPAQYERMADIVQPDDFGWHCYGWAWEAMRSLTEKGMTVDIVTLGDELDRMGKLQEFTTEGMKLFTGRVALSKVKEIQTKPEAAEAYALTVNDYAIKRKLLQTASDMAGWAVNGRTAAAIMADVEAAFSKLVVHSGQVITHTYNSTQAVAKAVDETERASKGEKPIQSGLIDVDKLTGGWHKRDLITVAARPGVGKTAFLLTCFRAAAQSGKRPLMFSIEMGVEQVTQRLIAQISGIPANNIRDGNIKDGEWEEYWTAVSAVEGMDFTVNDLSAISIGAIRVEARKVQPDIIFVDYIQLARASARHDRRDQEIGEITRGLKALAKELDVPILTAAQLNREVEARSDKRPILRDLRESGDIEQDSDLVMFLWPKDDKGIGCHLAKHRHGPTGEASLYYNAPITRFDNAGVYHTDFTR